jgi:hypothetical protein
LFVNYFKKQMTGVINSSTVYHLSYGWFPTLPKKGPNMCSRTCTWTINTPKAIVSIVQVATRHLWLNMVNLCL